MLDLALIIVIILAVILFEKQLSKLTGEKLGPLKNSAIKIVDFNLTKTVIKEEQRKNKKSISYVFTIIGGFSVIFLVMLFMQGKNEAVALLDTLFKLTMGDIIPMGNVIGVYADTFIIKTILVLIQNLSFWFVLGIALSFVIKPLSIVNQVKFIFDKIFIIAISMNILYLRLINFAKKTTFVLIVVTVILVNVFKNK